MSSSDTTTQSPSTQAALLVAVLAMSTAAVLARRAGEAPATVIAFWRCALAASVLAPAMLFGARRSEYRRELTALTRTERALLAAAGVSLGLHFQTWISSLEYTTIASSSVLVSTTPVWVALGAAMLAGQARDPLPRGAALALGICVLGSITIGWGDFGLSRRALGGDALALAGALFAALYLLAGRRLRGKVSLAPYLTAVYGVAALWLLASCALEALPILGYRRTTGLAILAIALVPQLIGHSTFNWALRWTSARLVAVAALGEPIFSTLWGFLLEREVPGVSTWIGGALLLLGIYLALRAERPREPLRPLHEPHDPWSS